MSYWIAVSARVLWQMDTSYLLVVNVGIYCIGALQKRNIQQRGSTNIAFGLSKAVISSLGDLSETYN